MVKLDYKLTSKELYAPKEKPSIIQVPAMNFIMVEGQGNPNDEDGEYKKAVEVLYALSYSIKMSRKFTHKSARDFMDYVVPPLEGLWWLNDENDLDFTQKSKFCWISMIRVPDFITREEFLQAQESVKVKKPDLNTDLVSFESFEEGLCVQCMHIGPFDQEPVTIEKMNAFVESHGYAHDIGAKLPDGKIRRHHEIYLSDPRKVNPAKMKTILRHPIKLKA